MSIVNKHPDKMSPLGISLVANDGITTSGVAHRSLAENGHNDVLLKYMEDALQKHHISPDALQRHMDLITSLKIKGLPILRSPYPQDFTTQKGNFAEVFLAEYLSSTTDAQLPIYRLRYAPQGAGCDPRPPHLERRHFSGGWPLFQDLSVHRHQLPCGKP